ncbi:Oidioi.mRNA.OKI2018_I69.PAR.g8852.t1.cds [Oikopleura dioica]|uniref:Oidioi.mRNA.OKI2018_I69.PAR.g8852.t1.cds n=1 Tax=Oikopleura dioica TaxID=34765 RepID=A0ABN7RQG2_OIKDI|nr:Oidioi.mRNA.OKI2018_I69.PAR.g8852.t1.cds [Oikopleura dioica]
MDHVKQGAIEVGTDIWHSASTFFTGLLSESSESSSSSYDYYDPNQGLSVIINGNYASIIDQNGNKIPMTVVGENMYRLNDRTNLVITNGGLAVVSVDGTKIGYEIDDYDYQYELNGGASPFMIYGLLFSCLISLMILFAIMVKRRRMMIHRRYLLARNSLATAADFAVVDSEIPSVNSDKAKKNVNDAPPSYETVTEQDKMLPKYEDV